MGSPGHMASVDEAYANTDVHVQMASGEWVVCTPHGRPAALAAFGTIYVITAHNPFPRMLDDAENRARNERLRADLESLAGCQVAAAVGIGRDEQDHREDSWAAWGISLEAAVDLGRQYGQRAIFAIDSSGLTVVRCQGDPGPPA